MGLIVLGSAVYAFAFVYFYMANKIAANGLAGLTLVGKALLGIDLFVMVISLTYISLPQMMYALIASFMYGQIVHLVQNGGYTVRGTIIISDQADLIADFIMRQLGLGVTYLNGEGAYSGNVKKVIYVALSRRDVRDVRQLINTVDPQAFISIFDVDEFN